MRDTLIRLLRAYDIDKDERQILEFFDSILAGQAETLALNVPKVATETNIFPTAQSDLANADTVSLSPHRGEASDIPEANVLTYYQLEAQIGKGGMGEVWRVRDPVLNRRVALKMLNTDGRVPKRKLAQFAEEAQISAQLQHPGIVPIYALHHTAHPPAFTMREIEGRTLGAVIRDIYRDAGSTVWAVKKDGWSLRRVLSAFHSVCETIAYAHSRGVVHLDLKPSNIMLGSFGEVLVVDWGIAKVLSEGEIVINARSELGQVPRIEGTPAYMSPEQASGNQAQIGPLSDIYSLGVVLYVILHGKLPYGGTVEDTLRAKKAGQPISFSPESRSPKALIAICEKATQAEPEDRYARVTELAEAIQNWLEGSQRREKVLDIIRQADGIEAQRQALLLEAGELWHKANQSIEADPSSVSGWLEWAKIQALRIEAKTLQQEIHQLLQGAVIYNSDVADVHRRLVALEYEDYLDALRRSDIQREAALFRRIEIYLDNLPKDEENHWRHRRKHDLSLVGLNHKSQERFIGRLRDQMILQDHLDSERVTTLIGAAGVGKTQLALKASLDWAKQSGADVIFCDLAAVSDELGIFQVLAQALQLTLLPNQYWVQIESALEDKSPALLVLDNVEQVRAAVAIVVERIAQSKANIHILMTSRSKLDIRAVKNISLQPMSILEGVELFLQKAQAMRPDFEWSLERRQVMVDIVVQLDRLPLAIELAAARVTVLSIEAILSRLSQRFQLLRDRRRDPKQQALEGALDCSWGLLDESARRVLLQSAIFQSSFTLEAAEAVIELDKKGAESVMDMLESLCDDSLIQREYRHHSHIRYRMLGSIQAYALLKYQSELESDFIHSLQWRHAAYYSELYQRSLTRDPEYRTELILQEISNFKVAVEVGSPEDSFYCCLAAMQYFHMRGPVASAVDIAGLFLNRGDLYEAIEVPIRMERIRSLRSAGQIEQARQELDFQMSNSKEERYRQAVRAAEASGDLLRKVHALWRLASFYDRTERLSDAKPHYEAAKALCETLHQEETLALIEVDLSLLNSKMGELVSSLSLLRQSGQKLRQDTEAFGIYLCKKAQVYFELKKEEMAHEHLNRAAELSDELGIRQCKDLRRHVEETRSILGRTTLLSLFQSQTIHYSAPEKEKYGRAVQLVEQGHIEELQSRYDAAIGYFTEALELYTELGHDRGIAEVLNLMSHIHRLTGAPEKSLQCLEQAVVRLEQVPIISLHGRVYTAFGKTHSAFDAYDKALEYFGQATEVYQKLGNLSGEGIICGNMAWIYYSLGQSDKALEYYHRAVQQVKAVGDFRNEGVFLGNSGLVYQHLGLFEQAIESYQGGMAITNQLGDRRSEGIFIGNIGTAYRYLGRLDVSKEHYYRAIDILEQLDAFGVAGFFWGKLGEVLAAEEAWEEAEAAFKKGIEACHKNYKAAAGAYMGGLGRLLGGLGRIEEGITVLSSGEPLVLQSPIEYGKFLCQKAELFHLAGQTEVAAQAFRQAQEIGEKIQATFSSELGLHLGWTAVLLDAV